MHVGTKFDRNIRIELYDVNHFSKYYLCLFFFLYYV